MLIGVMGHDDTGSASSVKRVVTHLQIEQQNAVGILRFDRPDKKNALTKETLQSLPHGVARLVAEGARAIILTGSSTVFTAGADLSEFSFSEADLDVENGLALAADSLAAAPVPVIAAIEGPCLGAGVELTMACDVRVAGSSAFFMIPAAQLGILYRPDGVERILDELGPETTRRLFLLHEQIGAAAMAGLVTADGQAFEEAMVMAIHAATLVPGSVAATKSLINELVSGQSALIDWTQTRRRLLRER